MDRKNLEHARSPATVRVPINGRLPYMVCAIRFSCKMPRRPWVECEKQLRVRMDTKESMSSNRLCCVASISSLLHFVHTYTKRPSDPSVSGVRGCGKVGWQDFLVKPDLNVAYNVLAYTYKENSSELCRLRLKT